ncbi:MAG: AAA family ATPase [Actinomycetota bacterium]|nr:AAA family ATPase [Actinomycetota bacterium]
MSEPAVTWFDTETARVNFDRPDPIQIDFARISETVRADATVAIVTITTDIASIGAVAGPVRVNLYSASAIDGLRRSCQTVTSVPDWSGVLRTAIAAVLDTFGQPEWTDIDPAADWPQPAWLLPPLLETDGYTVLYARGGSGKSYLAAAACVSIASGVPLLGMEPSRVGPVAYLDWEAPAATFGHRIARICDGNEVGTLAYPIRHYRMTGPFAARRAGISPALARLKPALVVIDSKGRATTGAPESSEGILDLARALDHLDMPVLLIDHISKGAIRGDDPDMAFGSVFVEASARLGWSLRTEHRAGSMVLRLTNTKANNHARRTEPLILELMFSGQGVTVLADSSAGRPVPGTEQLPAHADAILDYLADHPPTRQTDIARALGIHPTQVKRVLESSDGFSQTDDLWTVFTPPDHPPF